MTMLREAAVTCANGLEAGSPTISVALCTRNGAQFIGEQIRSICLQTLVPMEIVLSDDASHDDTVTLARQAVAECVAQGGHSGVTLRVLLNSRALGITRNFEQAIRACRGELIVLCDQDDVWKPERLRRMASEFENRRDLMLLHSDAELIGAAGQSLGRTLFHALEVDPLELGQIHRGRAFDVLLRRNLVTGATVMMRRSLLRDALPFPPEWLHDEWLALIAAATGIADVVEAPLIRYRQHGSNQIGAGRLSLAAKIRLAFLPRGTRYQVRLAKAVVLEARLAELSQRVSPSIIEKIHGKVAHQRFRASLPRSRVWRLPAVLNEALRGRYDEFGQGRYNVIRDLLEPA